MNLCGSWCFLMNTCYGIYFLVLQFALVIQGAEGSPSFTAFPMFADTNFLMIHHPAKKRTQNKTYQYCWWLEDVGRNPVIFTSWYLRKYPQYLPMFYTYIPGGAGLGFTEPSTTVGLCEYSPQSFVTSRDFSHGPAAFQKPVHALVSFFPMFFLVGLFHNTL